MTIKYFNLEKQAKIQDYQVPYLEKLGWNLMDYWIRVLFGMVQDSSDI